MDAPARSRVGVRVGGRTVDVAIPAGLPVYEALRDVGVDLDAAHLAVVDSAGRPVDRYSTTGDQLVDGSVLHVVSAARTRPGRASRRAEAAPDPAATRPGGSAWWLAAAGVAAVVVIAATLVGGPAGAALVRSERIGLVAALAVVALALATVRGRPGVVGSAWPTVVAALAGAAAGVVAVDPAMVGSGRLMVVAALTGALVTVAARWAVARRNRDDAVDLAAALLWVLAIAAALAWLGLAADLPPVLPAAVGLGAVPIALRALPALCVDVPDAQLLDTSLVARTASTVRAPASAPLGPVNERMVVRTVRGAERRRDAGTVLLCAVAPVLTPVVLLDATPGLRRWATLAACAFVVLALALGPRSVRGGLLHWVPRVAGFAVLVELVWLGSDGWAVTSLAVVGLGLAIAALSLPIGRGWRSVGASRLADALEGLATVLALPVALVGAGAIEVFRQLRG